MKFGSSKVGKVLDLTLVGNVFLTLKPDLSVRDMLNEC